MFWWVAFVCPPWYLACYTAASVRHAAWGVPHEQHRAIMRAWYGI